MIKKLLLAIFTFCIFSSMYAQVNRSEYGGTGKHEHRLYQTEKKYPGDETIDVTFYGINLNVDHPNESIKGSVEIRFRPAMGAVSSVYVDLLDTLTVDSVKGGNILLSYNHKENRININLDREYIAPEETGITVYYHGKPLFYNRDGMAFDTESGKPCMATQSEPFAAPYWWPCKDDPADKADSLSVTVTTDSALTVVSNGLMQSITDNGNGTKTTVWKHNYPIAHYLVVILTGNYHKYTNYFHYSETDSMPVEHYTYAGQFNEQRKEAYDNHLKMLGIFSDLFGVYPFFKEKFGYAQNLSYMNPMEHQTITTTSTFFESTLVHELAHQWFGDKITCRNWSNIWLNEGFATYCRLLYDENIEGKNVYLDRVSNMIGLVTKLLNDPVYVYDIYDPGRIFSQESYTKGALVLHMLRGVIGDSLFFKTMYEYANKEELIFDTAVTEDLQDVAENISGMDLDYFFRQWVYGTGYPVYKITWNPARIDGRHRAYIDLKQTTTGDVEFFKMPVEFGFVTVSGDTLVKQVMNDQPEQHYTILLEEDVTDILFDPYYKIIHEVEITTEVKDEKEIPAEYSLGQNYPNPFNPSTTINYSLPESGAVKIVLYDILGRRIATLLSEYKKRGSYEYELDTSGLDISSGVYLYSMEVNGFRNVKKLTLLK